MQRLKARLCKHWCIFRLKHFDSALFSVGLVLKYKKRVRDRGENQISVRDQFHHTSMIILILKCIFILFTAQRQKEKKTEFGRHGSLYEKSLLLSKASTAKGNEISIFFY